MFCNISRWNLEKYDGVYTGFIWLRIGTSGGLLWTRWWIFVFHKMMGSLWVTVQLAASQEGLSSIKLFMFCNKNCNENSRSPLFTFRHLNLPLLFYLLYLPSNVLLCFQFSLKFFCEKNKWAETENLKMMRNAALREAAASGIKFCRLELDMS
jgi:hypothetical protein